MHIKLVENQLCRFLCLPFQLVFIAPQILSYRYNSLLRHSQFTEEYHIPGSWNVNNVK